MKSTIFLLFGLSLSLAWQPLLQQANEARITRLSEKADDKLLYDKKTNRFYEADTTVMEAEEFCLTDSKTGEVILLTKEEKERIFLDSIQSYYFSGKNQLSDVEFNRLKEDLVWEGSTYVTLNRNETLFLNAMQAYNRGNPILSDKEFDLLKKSLRESNSKIAVSTEPKCYVDTGVCKVTWTKDEIRTKSLYVPASLIFTTLYIGVLYEIPFIRYYVNPLILLILGTPLISIASKQVTENFFFKDPLVAGGPCPVCSVQNKAFFGDVVGVPGNMDESTIKCTNCKSPLTVKRSSLRVSTLAPDAKKATGSKVLADAE